MVLSSPDLGQKQLDQLEQIDRDFSLALDISYKEKLDNAVGLKSYFEKMCTLDLVVKISQIQVVTNSSNHFSMAGDEKINMMQNQNFSFDNLDISEPMTFKINLNQDFQNLKQNDTIGFILNQTVIFDDF